MKVRILLLLLIFYSSTAHGQNELLHAFQQKPGNQQEIADWFSGYGYEKENLYSVILPLGACPRCEGAIVHFFRHLKELDPEADFVILAIYPEEKAAHSFMAEKEYGEKNYIYLKPSDAFLDNFHFSGGTPQVPYLARFSPKEGVLIKSLSLLGSEYSFELAEEFFKAEKPQELFSGNYEKEEIKPEPLKVKGLDIVRLNLNNNQLNSNLLFEFIKQKVDESEFVVSQINSLDVSDCLNWLILDDHLSDKSILYRLSGDHYEKTAVFPIDDKESRMFVEDDVPEYIYRYFKQTNMIHVLYLKSKFSGTNLYTSASLPHLFWDNKEKEELGYMNKAVIIKRNLASDTIPEAEYFTPESNMDEEGLINHIEFFTTKNDLFIPFEKGWPKAGTGISPSDKSENTFLAEFYDNTPVFRRFDFSGNKKDFGQLPAWHRKMKTGYMFFKPGLFFHEDGRVFLSDKIIGNIHLLDSQTGNILETYPVFEYEGYPPVHSEEPSLEYFSDIGMFLNALIIDFIIDGDEAVALVQREKNIYLLRFPLNNPEERTVKIIPSVINNQKVKAYKLAVSSEDTVRVICSLRDETSLYISTLSF